MRVVALFRVSTERQANEGASLDAQQRAYRDMATRNGWTTVAEFRGCESATQAATDRRVLQQVLACIRENPVDAVYVHEQSRLTRGDELEVALLLRELRERRLKIIVGGVVRDLASIDERFMVGIQSLVDRAESERIKERLTRGKRERARQGRKNSGPCPFGYSNPPPGARGRGTLQIVPEQAAVVRRIFALAVAGTGEHSIARALNDSAIAAPRGGRWGKSTVRRILNCPAYAGTQASNVWVADAGNARSFRYDPTNEKAVVIENAHAPLIDRATWDAVRNRARPPTTRVPRLLSGLLHINGEKAHGEPNHGEPYYRGPRHIRGGPWLQVGPTDDAVWDAFVSLTTSPAFVERLLREANNPHEQAVVANEIEYLEEQVGRQKRRLTNLLDMRADGEIDKAAYQTKAEECRRAIAAHERELTGLRAKAVVLDGSHAARVVKAIQTLLAGRTRLTADQKRAVLTAIVRRVDVAAEPTRAVQPRAKGGAFAGKGGPRWAVRSVALRLALPPEDAADAAVAAQGATGEGELAVARPGRSRHSGTTYWDCDQVTVTVARDLHTDVRERSGRAGVPLTDCGKTDTKNRPCRRGHRVV